MTLAIIAEGAHEGAAFLIRLGSLLPFALVSLAWLALRARPLDAFRTLSTVAAVAVAGAGVIHLALVPEHARQGLAPGIFFVAAGLSQLLLAGLVVCRRGGRAGLVALCGLSGGFFALYGVSRTWGLPGLGSEPVDALGLLTKALELVGSALAASALTGWPRRLPIDGSSGLALLTLVAAGAARPTFGLGSTLPQTLAALLAVLGILAVLRHGSRQDVLWALVDAGVVSLLLRAEGLVPFVVAGSSVTLLRHLARRLPWPVVSPLALVLLAALLLPGGARLEIFHVAHPGQPWVVLLAFLLAIGLLAHSATGRGFPATGFFLVAHLGGQTLRLLMGRTSLEAVEVPAASLGLLLVAAVVLADPDVVGRSRSSGLVAGLLAGALDVVLRELGVPYAPLWGVTAGVAAGAMWEAWAGRRARGAESGGQGADTGAPSFPPSR